MEEEDLTEEELNLWVGFGKISANLFYKSVSKVRIIVPIFNLRKSEKKQEKEYTFQLKM